MSFPQWGNSLINKSSLNFRFFSAQTAKTSIASCSNSFIKFSYFSDKLICSYGKVFFIPRHKRQPQKDIFNPSSPDSQFTFDLTRKRHFLHCWTFMSIFLLSLKINQDTEKIILTKNHEKKRMVMFSSYIAIMTVRNFKIQKFQKLQKFRIFQSNFNCRSQKWPSN